MKALFFENKIQKVMALRTAQLFNRYAALGRFSPLRYEDIAEPRLPNPRWLKVKNKACGLCGTDIHFMFMDLDPKTFSAAVPGIARKFLGHELLGEVVECGAEVEGFRSGDRVALRIDWPSCYQLEIDPPCPQCASGHYMLCENVGKKDPVMRDTGGGFSPCMVMHRTQPYRVLDALSDDQALLLEPLACAVHGVLKAKPAPGDKVLVIGGGTIGLLTVAAVRALAPDAQVYCLTRYDFQQAVARKLGAEVIGEGAGTYAAIAQVTGGKKWRGYFGNEIILGGFHVVYDTVGNEQTLQNALRWTRGKGTVVVIGIHFKPGKLDYSPVWCQEVNVMGVNCHGTESDGRNSFDHAAELLDRGCVSPNDIITHRYPIANYKEAVKAFLNKGTSKAIKIVLDVE